MVLTDDNGWTPYDCGYQARCRGETRDATLRVYDSADLVGWQAGWDAADKLRAKGETYGNQARRPLS